MKTVRLRKRNKRKQHVPLESGGMGTRKTRKRLFGGTRTVEKQHGLGEDKAIHKTVIIRDKHGNVKRTKKKQTRAGKKSKIYGSPKTKSRILKRRGGEAVAPLNKKVKVASKKKKTK